MLLAGGNAVDAAVATAFAVGVVEPQMSGVGGGGSALVWMQGDGHADYLDFYASQPVQAFRTLEDPAVGATTPLRIVGVPGDVAGLLALQERYGRLTRAQVMAPAIRLAQSGFPVNQILAQMIARDSVKLQQTAAGSDLLWPGGRPLGPGERIVNPELAASLRYVSQLGHAGFYQGQLARRVVAAMNAGGHPVTAEQFARYEPRWRRPLCAMYRGRVVLSAPPPQTGMQVIHTLKLLESYDLPSLGLPTRSAQAFDVMASALRNGMPLVGMNGDPSWANVPAVGVISDEFAAERRRLVGTGTPPDTVPPADPAQHNGSAPQGQCASFEPYRQPATVAGSGPEGAAPYGPVEGPVESPMEGPVDGPMEGGACATITIGSRKASARKGNRSCPQS